MLFRSKVEVTVSKDGVAKEKKTVHIKAKDKNAALFQAQVSHHKAGYKVHDSKHKGTVNEEVYLDEVLTKDTPKEKWIHDFVHSKNPKFEGKSKKERIQQALGAYYAKQRNEEFSEDLAMPLLGGSDIAKNKTDDTQDEIEMVRTELRAIANKVMHMLAAMPKDHHVEPWVQAKIAMAKSEIGAVHDYMVYSEDKPQENETMDTPMTFPNMANDNASGINV